MYAWQLAVSLAYFCKNMPKSDFIAQGHIYYRANI